MTDAYEPNLLGFLCNWCSYAGADLAGVSRLQYPPNVKIIRTMCSGRIDPALILEAFIKGADGVIITGCHIDDCHYQTGNYQTRRRYTALEEAMKLTSMEPECLRLEWVSASEGARFAEVMTSFTEQVRAVGPNPIKQGGDIARNIISELKAVKAIFNEHGERTLVGKEGELLEKGNVYGETIDKEWFNRILNKTIRADFLRNYILVSSQSEAVSIPEIAERLNMDLQPIVREVSILLKKNMLAIDHQEGRTPMFMAIVQEAGAC